MSAAHKPPPKTIEIVLVFRDTYGQLSEPEMQRRALRLGEAVERLFPGMCERAFIQNVTTSGGSSTPGNDPALN